MTLTSGSSTAVAIQEGVVLDNASTASFSFTEQSSLNDQTHPSGINITTLSALIPSIITLPSHYPTWSIRENILVRSNSQRFESFTVDYTLSHRRICSVTQAIDQPSPQNSFTSQMRATSPFANPYRTNTFTSRPVAKVACGAEARSQHEASLSLSHPHRMCCSSFSLLAK